MDVEVGDREKLDEFFERLAATDRRALLLDYDGTLAPFREQRSQAEPYPGVRELLNGILAARNRLVMVTGRAAMDLPVLLNLDRLPEIWGSHGLERLLPRGRVERFPLDDRQQKGLREALAWVREAGLQQRFEWKYGSLALHWRGLPEDEINRLSDGVRVAWEPMAVGSGLELRNFDGGLELRAPGHDKGTVVRTVLDEEGEGALAAYLGDDLTDEDAFRALKGRGLGALVRREPHPTAADIRLQPPGEMLAFLERWMKLCQ